MNKQEAYAVTGYVADDLAQQLTAQQYSGTIDVKVERGLEDVLMRLDRADVTEVRVGSSTQGETLVQLILREGARVESVTRFTVDVRGIERFNDPILTRLTAVASVKVIMV